MEEDWLIRTDRAQLALHWGKRVGKYCTDLLDVGSYSGGTGDPGGRRKEEEPRIEIRWDNGGKCGSEGGKERKQKGQIGLGSRLKARADRMGVTQEEQARAERMGVGN